MNRLRAALGTRGDDRGVSLAELLVAIMVFGIVLAVVSTTFVSLTKATAQARAIDGNTRVASNAMSALTRTIRGARTVPLAAGSEAAAFSVATRESLTVYTAVNTDDSFSTTPRRVSFTVQADRALRESTVVATALPPSYWQFVGAGRTRTLGGQVATPQAVGTPLFSYVDFSGNPIAVDAAGAVPAASLPSIASVTVSLTVDRTSTPSSQAVTLQNTIALTNLARGATP
ncbi:type II secretion system protein J [Frigoribacterium sp. PhB24]|uniref:PulJ/GspJ family protein n=1 Tax=Frigoribacterium sp. PhB24 TaxID=2485204 RepID=UPI000FBC625E|nr:type II secretion system protein [Frigoribacterium sp. PhB24]ROS50400.1 prepilin-type N-terminal cleavage/methylation domain-containing protein [Frigoribacterium sp. PhB24]